MRNFEDRFDRRFNAMGKIFWIMFGLAGLIIVAGIVLTIFGITNPEAIGEFFGKIVEGFKSTQ
jgi:hypothetical protein